MNKQIMVRKRDSRLVNFDQNKIIDAVLAAFKEVDGEVTDYALEKAGNIADYILDYCEKEYNNNQRILDIEEIQNSVENGLMRIKDKRIAKAYILYREKRSLEREKTSRIVQAVKRRNAAADIENANANVDEKSFSGREKEASSDIQKIIALDYTLSKEISDAHKNMLLYQHDLEKTNLGIHNCLNIDFEKMLREGFATRNGDIRSPSCFSSACQLVAVIFQCQSQVQFGGVGAVHIDKDLAPYVKKSFIKHIKAYLTDVEEMSEENAQERISLWTNNLGELTVGNKIFAERNPKVYNFAYKQLNKEGRQAAEALFHNLNTLESRAGSQVPFTSLNYGRDTTPEGQLVCEWLLNASIKGIGKNHLTPIFPISIFQYKSRENAEPDTKNYNLKQLALESLSKRIYPNFVNCDWSEAHEDPNDPDTMFSTMGCRTMLGYDIVTNSYRRVGRGNAVPNTMILPKLGIEYGICLGEREKPDLEGFWSAFEELLTLCEKGLLERFNLIKKQSPSAAPFMYNNGTAIFAQDCEETVEKTMNSMTLAMGFIGIAETMTALFGKNHAEDKDIHAFALKIVKRINEYAKEASERNHLNFSCYATPAEGLCSTALERLRKQYGVIKGVTDRDWLTNSFHVPVWMEMDVFDKMEIEAPFCKYPTGGQIMYIELDSTFVKNTKAIEQIIDYAFKVLDIPYLAFNFPIDACLDCGYQAEFNDECPECHSKNIQQLRRVTGYLSTDWHKFNKGKRAEQLARVKHSTKRINEGKIRP